MRLPWPFGRRSPSEGPSSAATEAGAAGARSVDAGRPASAGPSPSTPTRAWAALPPIERTAGVAPLVAPSAPFLDDVPGHRPLPPILQPLGHDAGPAGPSGLVVAHPHPVPSLTSHVPMPTLAVQRRAAAHEDPSAWMEPAPDLALEAAATPSGSSAAPVDPVPVRRVAPVSPAATAIPPARPLTRTTTLAPLGRPLVARSSAGADATQSAPGTNTSTSSPDPDLPLGPRRGATESSGFADRASMGGAAPEAGRRPGLGAPIPAAPPPAVTPMSAVTRTPAAAQRLPMRAPVRPHTSAAAASDARAAALAGSTSAPGQDAAAGASRTSRLPVLPVARRHVDAASSSANASFATAFSAPTLPGGGPTPTIAPGASPWAAAGSGRATRPTMGFRPIEPTFGVQRDADGATTVRSAAQPLSGEAAAAPVAAHWGSGETLPATIVSRTSDEPGTGQPTVQLSPLAPAAPVPGVAMLGGPASVGGPARRDRVPAA